MLRISREQSMRGTQRKGVKTESGCRFRQSSDTRHVADAAITGMTQRIDLRRQTGDTFTAAMSSIVMHRAGATANVMLV